MNDIDKMTFLRTVAVQLKDRLDKGEALPPVLLTYNREDMLTAVLTVDIDPADPDCWPKIQAAARVLGSAQSDLGRVVFVSDSYCLVDIAGLPRDKNQEILKLDGTPWGPGDMQRAMTDQTPDAKHVSDCLAVTMLGLDGAVSTCSVPYSTISLTHEGTRSVLGAEFDWDEATVRTEGEDEAVGGNVPDTLREAMAAPKAVDMAAEAGFPVPPDAGDVLLRTAAKTLVEAGYSVGVIQHIQ